MKVWGFLVNSLVACCTDYCAVLARLHKLIVDLVALHSSQLQTALLKGNSLPSGKALLANGSTSERVSELVDHTVAACQASH